MARSSMHKVLIVVPLVWLVIVPVGRGAVGTNDMPREIPIRQMVEADACLGQIQNPTIKSYLQKRLDGILALPDAGDRVTRFEAFLVELQAATPAARPAKETGGQRPGPAREATAPASPPVATNAAASAMDVEALNLLTKYACILYDLENRGFDEVRRELVDNVNAAGLQSETMAMLRQLVMICDEAERALSAMKNIKEDSNAETKALWWQNLGTYGATSVATADPLPLLQAAAGIVKGRQKVAVERDRKLDAEVQNHRGRLVNFLFELNIRRSATKAALGVDETEFLTKDIYDALQRALLDQNPESRLNTLRQCVAKCPVFREGLYYLAAAYHAQGQFEDAEQCLRDLTSRRSVVLRADGLLGGAYDILSEYSLKRGDASNAVLLARQALLNQPERGSAYNHLGLAYLKLGDLSAAARNLNQAIRSEPEKGEYYWSAAQLAAALSGREDTALTFLEAAVRRGYSDFKSVYGFEPLNEALKSERGQLLLQPKLMALCQKTLLNQQIVVSNLAAYPLTEVKVSLTLTQETSAGQKHETGLVREFGVISNGAAVALTSMRAMPSGSRCRMHLSYTCAQHPAQAFETTSCFNYRGEGENRWWEDSLPEDARRGDPTGPGETAPLSRAPLNSGQLRELLMQIVTGPSN